MVFSPCFNMWDMPIYLCSLTFFNIVSPFYFHVHGPARVSDDIHRLTHSPIEKLVLWSSKDLSAQCIYQTLMLMPTQNREQQLFKMQCIVCMRMCPRV